MNIATITRWYDALTVLSTLPVFFILAFEGLYFPRLRFSNTPVICGVALLSRSSAQAADHSTTYDVERAEQVSGDQCLGALEVLGV